MMNYTTIEKALFGLIVVLIIISIAIPFIPDMLLYLV